MVEKVLITQDDPKAEAYDIPDFNGNHREKGRLMSLTNIVDHRKRPYRFLKINCVIEPTCHDNCVKDADQVSPGYQGVGYDESEHVTLAAAIAWAQTFIHPVTLYLYDEDSGIYPIPVGSQTKFGGHRARFMTQED